VPAPERETPIEITIDRVDVRLTGPPPTPARTQATRPTPMSLEHYLESRGSR
jgi:hypothetical protein